MIRVVLIDDHPANHQLVTLALQDADDIELVGHGSNGLEALMLCEAYQPDIVVMDVVMPIMGGLEATRQILQKYPQIKILVLSSFQDDESVRGMLAAGAVGYILKGALRTEMVSTIRASFQGSTVLSSLIAQQLLTPARAPEHDFGLTERERSVLRLIADGMSIKALADHLDISQSTVKFHLNNILEKMAVETRAEAIVLAARHRLL